jgi:integrase
MFKTSRKGITITDILDTRNQRKNGEYPIKIRITYKSDSWYCPVNQYASKEEWDRLSLSNDPVSAEKKEAIEETYLLVKSHVNLLVEKGMFSFQRLKNSIKGTNSVSLNSLLKKHIEELRVENRIGTMISMQSTLNAIEQHFQKDVSIADIDLKWLKEYDKYLSRERKRATVYVHLRNIRVMVNLAITNGYIPKEKYPFGKDGYRFKTVYGRKKALTLEQIRSMANLKSRSHTLKKYRDLFIFMYLCNGITVDDLVMLKYENIHDDEIHFIRGKTKRTTSEIKEIRSPITPEMNRVIKLWGNPNHPKNYIFPLIKHTSNASLLMTRKNSFNKIFNHNLKVIGGLLGMDDLTTVIARHSFASIMKHSGVSIAFISESLGHKNITTTEHYLAQFDKEARRRNCSCLWEF